MPDPAAGSTYNLYRELSVLLKDQPILFKKFLSFGEALKSRNADQRKAIIIHCNKAIQTLEKSISEQEKSYSERLEKAERKFEAANNRVTHFRKVYQEEVTKRIEIQAEFEGWKEKCGMLSVGRPKCMDIDVREQVALNKGYRDEPLALKQDVSGLRAD